MDQPLKNSAAVENEHKKALENIQGLVAQSDRHFEGYRQKLNEALEQVFLLTLKLGSDGLYESFLAQRQIELGKVARENPFQPMVKLAFAGAVHHETSISKYAAVLKYAAQAKPTKASLSDWIVSEKGINEIASKARKTAPSDPLSRFRESPAEHYERALEQLQQQSLGRIKLPASVSAPQEEYSRALLRSGPNGVEVVRFLETEEGDIKNDIRSIIPPKPPLMSKELEARAHYNLFKLADIAIRFMEVDADPAGAPVDTKAILNDASRDTSVWLGAIRENGKKKPMHVPRYGLLFEHTKSGWMATTISTAPTFAGIKAQVDLPKGALDENKPYFLAGQQLGRIATDFLSVENWSVQTRESLGTESHEGKIVFDDFDDDKRWRRFDAPINESVGFDISSQRLQILGEWPRNWQQGKGNSSFPSLLALSHSNGQLLLRFPKVYAAGGGRAAQVRPLADVQLAQAISAQLANRWLRKKDLSAISELARDFAIEFKGCFLEMNEGPAVALRLSASDQFELIVPLVLGLGGHRASVTRFVR